MIPAGADADGGGEECRTTQNAATGEYLLECQGTTVSLGRCGLGFAGSVFLGPDTHSAMESFPSVDRRMNSRNIASFLDNGCSRVLGTVVVTSGATAEHRALLSELEYAESVHFIEPLAGVAMPKLRAAHLYLGEYAELWSSSLAPALTRGGVTNSGGELDGPLVLGALQEGVIEVADVEGLTHLRAPLLRTGSVVVSRAPDLEVVDLSALVNSERVFLSELESVEQLSFRALAWAGSLELGGLDSLEVLEFPALEVVAGAFELSMIGDITALTFPELNQIGSALRVSRSEALESMVFSKLSGADGVELRELAELRTVDFATLERVSYFEGFDLPELLEVRAPSLRALDARIGLVDSGYEGEGLSVDLRALERVASLDIDERRLRSLDLSSLTTIDAGDLTIVEGRYLREVIAPVLHEVAVYINVPADGPNVGPLVLDFSSHRFEESITGGMDGAPDYFVHVQNARPLELKMDDAVFTGSMEVDASDLSCIFSVGPGYRGSLVLRNVETGDFVDLTRASGLRFLFLDKVGVPLSPVFGDFSEAVFEELRIFGTALDHLFFGLADGARLEVKDGSATGDLVLTNAPAGELWEEREAHEAEQAFYDRGGVPRDRRLTSEAEVRIAWLREQGRLPAPERLLWSGELPPGFRLVAVAGRRLAVSDLVDLTSFRRMLVETGYLERRDEVNEPWDRANDGDTATAPVGASWADAQAFCAWKERQLGVALRLPTKDELRAIHPFHSERYAGMCGADFLWENYPPRPLEKVSGDDVEQRIDVPSAVIWSEPRFLEPGPDQPQFPPPSGWGGKSRKRWIVDFPPRASWREDLPWAEYSGLRFIDAWDAYEWCQEVGWIHGRFWDGEIGLTSWGAYKNVKVTFRLVLDLEV